MAQSTRRHFLRTGIAASASLAVAGATRFFFGPGFSRAPRIRAPIPGKLLGASSSTGHLLRTGFKFPAPSEELETDVAIVGSGISGLSAAWKLGRLGVEDYLLLELEREAGGNARGGRNAVSAYPWGAHYVPLPSQESRLVRELFEELGVITGYEAGLPVYNEFFLCADPHERLFISGAWQEGMVPQSGVSELEREQLHRFFARMEELRAARGSDGKPAFAIPIAESSRDPRFTALDHLTMAEWLEQNHFDAPALKWYVNYCCRDDYGTVMKDVSAWAGIHYFASRRGTAANADSQTVITWPEGNAWLAGRLRAKAGDRLRPNSLVYNVEEQDEAVLTDCFDPETKRTTRIRSRAVIYCAPRFTASHVLKSFREKPHDSLRAFSYAPWMVANVTVSRIPSGPGAPPSWDNVSYHSPSLGYIIATHQNLGYRPVKSVLTYYQPLSDEEPARARERALAKTHPEWVAEITADLERMHPDIAGDIENIDVWLWGHAMIRPVPGFLWGPVREAAAAPDGNVFFAHSDMSGISIFEEAQYQGAIAAEAVASRLRRRA